MRQATQYFLFFFFYLFLGLSLGNSVYAEDDYFARHFSGTLNYYYSDSGEGYRENSNFTFKWEDNFDESVATLGIELYAFRSRLRAFFDNEIARTSDPGNLQADITVMTERNEIAYNSDAQRLNAVYLKLSGDWAELFIGREKIIWGQFDVFSPASLLLPFDFSDTSIKLNKVDYTLPLTNVRVSFYPSESTELSFYYFPDVEKDEVTNRLSNNQFTQRRYDTSNFVSRTFVDELSNRYTSAPLPQAIANDEDVRAERLEGLEQTAVRFVYTGDVIFGITYFDGYWGFAAEEFATANLLVPADTSTDLFDTFGFGSPDSASRNTGLYNRSVRRVGYNQTKALSLELAVPTSDYDTFKMEYTRFLDPLVSGDINIPRCANISEVVAELERSTPLGQPLSSLSAPVARVLAGCNPDINNTLEITDTDIALLDLIERNGRRLYVESELSILALGVDHITSDLSVFFSIFGLITDHSDISSEAERLGISVSETVFGPSLVVIDRYGDNYEHKIQFTLGSIGIVSGFSLSYAYEFDEGSDFVIGVEGSTYSNDGALEDDLRNDIESDPDVLSANVNVNNDTQIGLRAGFTIKF